MRPSNTAVFLAVDDLLTPRGKPLPGLEDFLADLNDRGIPCIWLTARSRAHVDEPWRRIGYGQPFIAESGAGVYLPEGYFHLKPVKTIRMGRFTCIPVSRTGPAAAEALELLSQETSVPVVPLASLTPRELAQNIGLPPREAELARMRDFSELFFFAGAAEQIASFLSAASQKGIVVRHFGTGAIFSLAVSADESTAIRELSKLYDRALRARILRVGVATPEAARRITSVCDRVFELASVSASSALEAILEPLASLSRR